LSVAVAFTLVVLCAPARSQEQTPWEKHLDGLIEKGMSEYHVPGLAVGIVLNGKLAYARGFGQTTLGQPPAVTPDTLFHMASVTKPLSRLQSCS
jgi:CubicO group peptidase (beta-lactamase class C family)